MDANYTPVYQPNELFITPYTDATVPTAKLTWMKEFENGTKLYLKIRGQTYSVEWDKTPNNLVEFKFEFKKGF